VSGRVAVLLAASLCFATAVSACPVCIGDTDSQMAQGANNAVLFMLAIVAVVQIGLVGMFLGIRRRARSLRQRREQLQLIEGGAR
jgi:hypothetical protein